MEKIRARWTTGCSSARPVYQLAMLLYHIDWYVDNDTVIQGQTVSKSSLDNATLSAHDMNNAGKKINS